MILAIAQPLLGIPLLAATKLVGRSGLLGGALVLSILMLLDGRWSAPAWVGIAGSVLLLVGDFGTRPRPSPLLAGVLAVGYATLIVWFSLLAVLLL